MKEKEIMLRAMREKLEADVADVNELCSHVGTATMAAMELGTEIKRVLGLHPMLAEQLASTVGAHGSVALRDMLNAWAKVVPKVIELFFEQPGIDKHAWLVAWKDILAEQGYTP